MNGMFDHFWHGFCLCGSQPPQMGSLGMMNPPTMMYSQPVMRPPNPFGSVSSAQVSGAGPQTCPPSVTCAVMLCRSERCWQVTTVLTKQNCRSRSSCWPSVLFVFLFFLNEFPSTCVSPFFHNISFSGLISAFLQSPYWLSDISSAPPPSCISSWNSPPQPLVLPARVLSEPLDRTRLHTSLSRISCRASL